MASTDTSIATISRANGDTQEDESFQQNGSQDILTSVKGEVQKLPYPKSVFFIIGNEFCERFNYLGMRAIQALYFTQKLMFDQSTATVLYHTFTSTVYFMCIFGAILSDSFLGKFKTILYLSLVYALGNTIVALAAIPVINLPTLETTGLGMLLIAIGSGGIKPCVAAFGGDQFKLPAQFTQMATFFSIFYFSINVGSLLSTFILPILRQDVHCFGDNDCYSLAFGAPGVLMAFAIILFVSGKTFYQINPPTGNVLIQVTKCIKNAIVTRIREKNTNPREHWLDYSEAKYGAQLVADTKVLMKILVLYIPLPLFWSLFDQQGSRWIFQAQKMNGNIGIYTIKPDQMHFFNPFLVLVFIPLYETVIYPLLAKIGIHRPLQKMKIGMFLVALAFFLAGIVELENEKRVAAQPVEGQAELRFINGLPCNFTASTNIPSTETFDLNQFTMFEQKFIRAPMRYEYTLKSDDPKCPKQIRDNVLFVSQKATTIFVSSPEIKGENNYIDGSQRAQIPMLRVVFSSLGDVPQRKVKIITRSNDDQIALIGSSLDRQLVPISSGVHDVYIDSEYYKTITLKNGSVSTLIVFETPNGRSPFDFYLVEATAPNPISMLWQLPQYVVISLAEVMFSITGIQFSYSQAPASMKSVLQACWHLTVAFGEIIIIIIAGARIFHAQSNEFFLFTGLMVLDMFLFMIFARKYESETTAGPVSQSQATSAPLPVQPILT